MEMSDFIFILWLSSIMWINVTVAEQQHEVNQHLAMVDENMAVVWQNGEALTKELKECKKLKGRR